MTVEILVFENKLQYNFVFWGKKKEHFVFKNI